MTHFLFIVFGNGNEGIHVNIKPDVKQNEHTNVSFIGVVLTALAHWPKHPAIPLF